jgi:hypothetical protein
VGVTAGADELERLVDPALRHHHAGSAAMPAPDLTRRVSRLFELLSAAARDDRPAEALETATALAIDIRAATDQAREPATFVAPPGVTRLRAGARDYLTRHPGLSVAYRRVRRFVRRQLRLGP